VDSTEFCFESKFEVMMNLNFRLFTTGLLAGMLAMSMASCTKKEGEKLALDPQLFGTWVFVDADNEVLAWTFRDNGTCTQSVYGENYAWRWEIENAQLKLFVTGGIPSLRTYKVEGNALFFWVESIEDWSLPFTRQ
jgi:hypothetical protein